MTVVSGIADISQLQKVLCFFEKTQEELDYSKITDITLLDKGERCVYCNHCAPSSARF